MLQHLFSPELASSFLPLLGQFISPESHVKWGPCNKNINPSGFLSTKYYFGEVYGENDAHDIDDPAQSLIFLGHVGQAREGWENVDDDSDDYGDVDGGDDGGDDDGIGEPVQARASSS